MNHPLRRIIGGMRKTALAEGFLEHEVAGVYDKRMLNVLFKAWMYDQGMAVGCPSFPKRTSRSSAFIGTA